MADRDPRRTRTEVRGNSGTDCVMKWESGREPRKLPPAQKKTEDAKRTAKQDEEVKKECPIR